MKTKIGRNEPCMCGSGKKFKKCCMNKPQVNTFTKHEIPKGVKTVTLELREGKEYLKKFLKYNPTNPISPEEHFNQPLRYVFYNENEDYNFTIQYNHDSKDFMTPDERKLDDENMKYCVPSVQYDSIRLIKEQQMSKGTVDDNLIQNTEYLMKLFLRRLIVPSLIEMFKENSTRLQPPLYLYKNFSEMRSGDGDYLFKFKREGTKTIMEFSTYQKPDKEVPWVKVISKTGLSQKEVEETLGF